VSIPIWYVFSQESDEIARRIRRAHSHFQSLVFQGELDRFISDFLKTVLSNRRPASITACISQEMLLGLEIIDMRAPPSVFARQQRFQVAGVEIRLQHANVQSLSKESNYGESPHVHQLLAIKIQAGGPTSTVQTSGRDQNVQMAIEVEPSAECVRYHHNQGASAEFDLYPLLYDRSSQRG
jgi:hypothetical protein